MQPNSTRQLRRRQTFGQLARQGSLRTLAVAKRRLNNLRALRALCWFVVSIFLGGAIFSALERPAEAEQRRRLAGFLQRMRAELSPESFSEMLTYVGTDDRVAEELTAASLDAGSDEPALAPHDWDFTGACFFCFTAATTIGYGNYTPRTWVARPAHSAPHPHRAPALGTPLSLCYVCCSTGGRASCCS